MFRMAMPPAPRSQDKAPGRPSHSIAEPQHFLLRLEEEPNLFTFLVCTAQCDGQHLKYVLSNEELNLELSFN